MMVSYPFHRYAIAVTAVLILLASSALSETQAQVQSQSQSQSGPQPHEAIALSPRVSDAINRMYPELENVYNDLHRHPGTGFEEKRTAAKLAGRCARWASR